MRTFFVFNIIYKIKYVCEKSEMPRCILNQETKEINRKHRHSVVYLVLTTSIAIRNECFILFYIEFIDFSSHKDF